MKGADMPPLQITITGTVKDIKRFLKQSEMKGTNRIVLNGVTFVADNVCKTSYPDEVYMHLELTEVKELKI